MKAEKANVDKTTYKPRIFRVADGEYYIEGSPERRFCYRVLLEGEDGKPSCTCGDYSMESKKDPDYQCDHIEMALKSSGELQGVEFFEKRKPKLDERFLTTIQGRDFVVYAGLLDLGHQRGLRSIQVEILQYPTAENGQEAIAKAIVESEQGDTFVEWGDANPKNVNPMIARHVLRMAATRAKARALRDFTNIGITCLEELADLDEVVGGATGNSNGNGPKRNSPSEATQQKQPATTAAKAGEQPIDKAQKTKKAEQKKGGAKQEAPSSASSAQIKALENLAKRRGMTQAELLEFSVEAFGRKSLDALTSMEASSLIRTLQQSA